MILRRFNQRVLLFLQAALLFLTIFFLSFLTLSTNESGPQFLDRVVK